VRDGEALDFNKEKKKGKEEEKTEKKE